MSVMIKGMKMPKTCAECPFLYDGDACYAMNKRDSIWLPLVINSASTEYKINQFPYKEKRVDWCPLVEVPTPHGKLVDIDAMIDRFWDGDYMEINCRDLGNIPVIVEPED